MFISLQQCIVASIHRISDQGKKVYLEVRIFQKKPSHTYINYGLYARLSLESEKLSNNDIVLSYSKNANRSVIRGYLILKPTGLDFTLWRKP